MIDPPCPSELATGYFLAVDPGVDHPAAALCYNGWIIRAARIKIPTSALRKLEEGERVRQIVLAIATWTVKAIAELHDGPLPLTEGLRAVVGEWPQAYSVAKSKGDHNQLFPLAGITAGVAIRFDAKSITPRPAEWIGAIPKSTSGDPWKSPRGALVWRRLGLGERAIVESTHDAVDAAGIALWALDRLGRSFPGAR